MSENPKDLHEVLSLREHVRNSAHELLGLQHWTAPTLEEVPDWLVPGFLQSEALHVLSSDSGCCKTWLGLTLMLSGLYGIPVLERKPVRPFSSIYLAADSTSWDIGQQLRKLLDAHKLNGQQPFDDAHAFIMPIGFLFDNEAHVNVIAEMARHWDIDTIFIDVMLYAHMANENDNAEMARSVLRAAKWLRDKTGLAVFLIHHNAKGGAYRGAGTITQAVEHHLTLFKNIKNVITLHVEKIRGDEDMAEDISFILGRPDHGGRLLERVSKAAPADAGPTLQEQIHHIIEEAGEEGIAREEIIATRPDLSIRSIDNALQSLRQKSLVVRSVDGSWHNSAPH